MRQKKTMNKKRKLKQTRKRKKTSKQCGSKYFQDGVITNFDETYNHKPFFRKIFWYPTPPVISNHIDMSQSPYNERDIIEILHETRPHPNIVAFYDIHPTHVDMELLDTENNDKKKAKKQMKKVKDFLQNLGIIYIDWKQDNIGIDEDGNYKLFDFDGSGIIDVKTRKWIKEPVHMFAFNEAKEHTQDPIEMDNWAFEHYL